MVMVVVVPIEEGLTKGTSIFNRAKLLGKLRLVLEGLELRFRIRIVIGDMGTRVSFGHAQITEQ